MTPAENGRNMNKVYCYIPAYLPTLALIAYDFHRTMRLFPKAVSELVAKNNSADKILK